MLTGCRLEYDACDYICTLIKERGTDEMRKADFSSIFEEVDQEEINNSLGLLLEAISEKNIREVKLASNTIDDSCAFNIKEMFSLLVSSRLISLDLNENAFKEAALHSLVQGFLENA